MARIANPLFPSLATLITAKPAYWIWYVPLEVTDKPASWTVRLGASPNTLERPKFLLKFSTKPVRNLWVDARSNHRVFFSSIPPGTIPLLLFEIEVEHSLTLRFLSLTSWKGCNRKPLNPSTSSNKPRLHSLLLEIKSIVFMDGYVSVIVRLSNHFENSEKMSSICFKIDIGNSLDRFQNMESTLRGTIKSRISRNLSHWYRCLQKKVKGFKIFSPSP